MFYEPEEPAVFQAASHQFMLETAIIPGLPDNLKVVPNDPNDWRVWAGAVRAYREKRRRDCARDLRQQAIEYEKCRRDPAYFTCIWGVIFEPRKVESTPPSWKPFILFPFQVRFMRWIQHIMEQEDRGRGDGVIEKSRDMGATNLLCTFAVHQFIFQDVFVCGFISRNYDQVYKKNSSDTIFYKLQAQLGLEDSVPVDLRLPAFLRPKGFVKDDHVAPGAIKNPEEGKTCYLIGETTTKLSGVSGRATMRVNDEAARFDSFGDAYANQQATTDHRFSLSSADISHGPAFYNLARLGQECELAPDRDGPSFMRLEWHLHPFHTPEWFKQQKARAMAAGDPYKFAREYEIDYFAEQGDLVYPRFKQMGTKHVPYNPNGGMMYCWIDNGIRDPAVFIYVQEDVTNGFYNVVDCFEGKTGDGVEFYASVITGTYLSGDYQYNYDEYAGIHQFMEFAQSITQPIRYVGDPAGHQKNGLTGEKSTWYKALAAAVKEVSGKSIHVNSITAENARTHTVRNQAVNELLPRMQFHNNLGGAHVLHCLKNSKYSRPTRGREVAEPTKPIHDEFSHARSAVEFGCVWVSRMTRSNMTEKAKPVRRSLTGNIVSGRQRNLFHPRER
jgi:hypothetical protein